MDSMRIRSLCTGSDSDNLLEWEMNDTGGVHRKKLKGQWNEWKQSPMQMRMWMDVYMRVCMYEWIRLIQCTFIPIVYVLEHAVHPFLSFLCMHLMHCTLQSKSVLFLSFLFCQPTKLLTLPTYNDQSVEQNEILVSHTQQFSVWVRAEIIQSQLVLMLSNNSCSSKISRCME
jgi:hypothetical protein